jgi:hypothetical protein
MAGMRSSSVPDVAAPEVHVSQHGIRAVLLHVNQVHLRRRLRRTVVKSLVLKSPGRTFADHRRE